MASLPKKKRRRSLPSSLSGKVTKKTCRYIRLCCVFFLLCILATLPRNEMAKCTTRLSWFWFFGDDSNARLFFLIAASCNNNLDESLETDESWKKLKKLESKKVFFQFLLHNFFLACRVKDDATTTTTTTTPKQKKKIQLKRPRLLSIIARIREKRYHR